MKIIVILFASVFMLASCSAIRDSEKLSYKAIGEEPPWTVEIKNDSLIFIYGYERDSSVFRSFEHGSTENRIIFNAKKRNEFIKVVFIEEECRDIMSGERYPYSATVEKDTLKLSGCAREINIDSTNSGGRNEQR